MLTSTMPLMNTPQDLAATAHSPQILHYQLYEKGHHLLKDRYKYIRLIQKGSFGQVTLALDVTTNTKVAMKAMHKAKEIAPIARHEIRVLRKLGHDNDNICQLLDHFETDDYIVLVLEYCANGDMYDIIHSGHNSRPKAVDVWNLAKELHLGLSYSHLLGIYHRDIKPENILFTETGRIKICDWGLATYNRFSTDFNVGTEKYMAPECFINSPVSSSTDTNSYDCKQADYWSVGVTLLTAVFGTSPFKPVRAHDAWGSADDFKRKNKSVKKSLESDSNFKNFVFYNMPEVLYDIYPAMNENCFKIFMNLLKVGGTEDDLESYNRKIQLRSMDKFMLDLESSWKFGLTVWEEEELYHEEQDDLDEPANHDSVFDMDDFSVGAGHDSETSHDLTNENGQTLKNGDKELEVNGEEDDEGYDNDDEFRVEDYLAELRRGGADTTVGEHTIPIPSLVESSYQPKSWYDLEDDLDDAEFSKLFNSLSFRNVEPVQITPTSQGKPVGAEGRNIHIIEKELVEGLSWSDY